MSTATMTSSVVDTYSAPATNLLIRSYPQIDSKSFVSKGFVYFKGSCKLVATSGLLATSKYGSSSTERKIRIPVSLI